MGPDSRLPCLAASLLLAAPGWGQSGAQDGTVISLEGLPWKVRAGAVLPTEASLLAPG